MMMMLIITGIISSYYSLSLSLLLLLAITIILDYIYISVHDK